MSAVATPLALEAVLARGDVWRGDGLAALAAAAVPSGHPELDAELPGGGWPRGGLTEFLCDHAGIGELSLLLPALARLSGEGGWLALVDPPWRLHAPAWAAAGIDLSRLIVVSAGRESAWCVEQLLASGGFAGVLAWPDGGLDARGLRRLQVAAEGRPVFAGLWRPAAAAAGASPAPLRIAARPAGDGLVLHILKRRGRPAARPLHLALPRPAATRHALAGPALSLAAARGAALAAVA